MLGLLGVIYYLLAIGAIYIGVSQHNGFLGGFSLLAALATALSCAFFGAMCFAADDIRTLLRRIADHSSGESVARAKPQPLDATAPLEEPAFATDAFEDQPASNAQAASPSSSEQERMADYDIVHDGTSFLAYGRVRHATLEAAVAYVKSTRGEGD
jgi:hypothetical protein